LQTVFLQDSHRNISINMNRDLSIYEQVTQQEYDIVAGPDWPTFEKFKTHQNIQQFVYDEIDTMLWNLVPFDNPGFCVLPFYATEWTIDNSCTVCCRLPKIHDLDAIKSDMLAGRRSPYCGECWELEDAGLTSDRIVKNKTVDFYSKTDIQRLFDQCVAGENSTIHYKIDSSNICNATCITCGSNSSSAWAQLERKNGIIPIKSFALEEKKFSDSINYKTAVSIGFRGGEPLLSDANFEILEKLLEKNNTDCFINFTTNGSIVPSEYQKKILAKFTNVNFGFSIDGIGPVFEYLRYPLEWPKILETIDYCRKNNILISVHHTVSNVNLYYYNQNIAWFNSNNIDHMTNIVSIPSHFRPGALSESIKNTIIDQRVATNLHYLIDHHTSKDQADYEVFKLEIAKQDRWKNIQLENYLPEFAKLLG
jgi:hypothetical protein